MSVVDGSYHPGPRHAPKEHARDGVERNGNESCPSGDASVTSRDIGLTNVNASPISGNIDANRLMRRPKILRCHDTTLSLQTADLRDEIVESWDRQIELSRARFERRIGHLLGRAGRKLGQTGTDIVDCHACGRELRPRNPPRNRHAEYSRRSAQADSGGHPRSPRRYLWP